ncbi:MAG TPA: hypothetical protein VKV27_05680 [Solirubrobacteraceae bacterium]|nr:hypothetical protein [Solirubrobacteraceae bacterium]
MSKQPPALTKHAERTIVFLMGVAILAVLELGLIVLGGPAAAAAVPPLLAAVAACALRADLAHVRRFGWWAPPAGDDPGGGAGSQPAGPRPGSPDAELPEFDWDAFARELAAYSEASRAREPVGVD